MQVSAASLSAKWNRFAAPEPATFAILNDRDPLGEVRVLTGSRGAALNSNRPRNLDLPLEDHQPYFAQLSGDRQLLADLLLDRHGRFSRGARGDRDVWLDILLDALYGIACIHRSRILLVSSVSLSIGPGHKVTNPLETRSAPTQHAAPVLCTDDHAKTPRAHTSQAVTVS